MTEAAATVAAAVAVVTPEAAYLWLSAWRTWVARSGVSRFASWASQNLTEVIRGSACESGQPHNVSETAVILSATATPRYQR